MNHLNRLRNSNRSAPSNARQERVNGFHGNRSRLVLFLLLTIFSSIGLRAMIIQVFPPSKEQLERIASKQYEQHLELAPYRGAITDRNGHPFAISLKKPSLAVNPRVFDPSSQELRKLSGLLDLPREKIREVASKKVYFSWLKRRIDDTVAAEIERLDLDGLYFINEAARTYPLQSLGAQIIGSVGSDNRGLLGIEHQFDKLLAGAPSKVSPAKDARGRTIVFSSDLASPDLPGHSVQLSIDHVIQEITEDSLKAGVLKARAKSGFAIVTDPHTGKILALANYPTFDPNAIGHIAIDHTRNYALLDLFEPGSVMKPFVVATAIEKKKTKPDEIYNCEKGIYRAGGVVFRDDHPADFLSTTETIVRSSNICTFKIAEKIGKQGLFDALSAFGFTGQLPLPEVFPQTLHGHISPPLDWKPIRFANVAFGQGMTSSGLELVMGYGALANGGNLMKPIMVEKITSPTGEITYAASPEVVRPVISMETSKQMREILAQVVTHPKGTGHNAATPWYTTGGKTGTAEKVDPVTRTYSATKRISSFIGIAPVEDPYLVIFVVIDEPGEKPYYGGLWAAPVFSAIAQESLRYLNVAPDKKQDEKDMKSNVIHSPIARESTNHESRHHL